VTENTCTRAKLGSASRSILSSERLACSDVLFSLLLRAGRGEWIRKNTHKKRKTALLRPRVFPKPCNKKPPQYHD